MITNSPTTMATTTMASAIYTPTYLCQSSSSSSSPTLFSSYNTPNFRLSAWIPQLGLTSFSQWNGLRNLGISISHHSAKLEKKKKCSGKGVFASLFGVGAPEALVIGVVALLVFGPKGLAEVARNMGKTLRAFQPTIKELQDVSREFKSTLEREIGLDDVQSPTQNNYSSSATNTNSSFSTIDSSEDSQMKVDPNGSRSTNEAYSSEDYLKITEEQLKAAAATQQLKQTDSLGENQSEPQPRDTVQGAGAVAPPPQNPKSET